MNLHTQKLKYGEGIVCNVLRVSFEYKSLHYTIDNQYILYTYIQVRDMKIMWRFTNLHRLLAEQGK